MQRRYRQKKYHCGEYLEVAIYPVYTKAKGRGKRCKPTSEIQKRLNQRHAEGKLRRLLHTNFTDADLFATLTFDDAHLPAAPEDAQKLIQNFLRRLKRKNKSLGLDAKYIYVLEYGQKHNRLHAQIEKQNALLARIARKKEALLDLRVDGAISNDEFKQRNESLDAEKKEAEENLEELELQRVSSEAHREHMAQIHAALKAAERDVANGTVTKEFIDTFIDKILVTPQEDGKMELDIRIFTGESTKKYLARLKSRASDESRTGRMSKKAAPPLDAGYS